jgi:hypothetical protein
VRLGFYFPRQAGPLVLDSLKNKKAVGTMGVSIVSFYFPEQAFAAYAAIPIQSVRDQVWKQCRESASPEIFVAGLPAAPVAENAFIARRLEMFLQKELEKTLAENFSILQRLVRFLQNEVGLTDQWYVVGPAILHAVVARFGEGKVARDLYKLAAASNAEDVRTTVCEQSPGVWCKELISLYLKDRRPLRRWQDGTRMCDLAALAIKRADGALAFDRKATAGDRDKQIEAIYRHCTGIGVRREPRP